MPSVAPSASPASLPLAQPETQASGRLGWVWRALLLLAGLAAAGSALKAMPRLDPHLLDRLVIGHGPAGVACFLGLGAFSCAVGAPRQVAAFAAGYAFAGGLGLWTAGALALAAQLLGCVADFSWARLLARGWVARHLPARLAALEARVMARPFTATLTLRLLPVGNNLALNLLGGVSDISPLPFLAATALGYLPQTAVCVLLGSGTQLGRATEIAVAAGLFAASAALGAWLWRTPAEA